MGRLKERARRVCEHPALTTAHQGGNQGDAVLKITFAELLLPVLAIIGARK